MALNDKEQSEKVFCVLHQKVDCSCLAPVTDNKTLVERLKHHIRLNKILNKHETDEAKKTQRGEQNTDFQRRLDELQNSS